LIGRVIDSDAIDRERALFADTLAVVGPDALTFIGRALVTRGVRLNDITRRRPQLAARSMESKKRRGFEATIASLRKPSPALLRRRVVRTVGLFEVWAHHEDVRRPNGLPRDTHPDLTDVIAWLHRYSKVTAEPDGPPYDVGYWLAGRQGGPRPI
jgi:hypothetical protein